MTRLRLDEDTIIDLAHLRMSRGQEQVPLTAMEARLLAYLATRDQAVGELELLREVWGYSPQVSSRTVQTTVGRLRKKLERDPGRPQYLLTEAGRGYRLLLAQAAPPPGRQRCVQLALSALERSKSVVLCGLPGMGRRTLAEAVRQAWRGPSPLEQLVIGDPGERQGAVELLVPRLDEATTRAWLEENGCDDADVIAATDGWPVLMAMAARSWGTLSRADLLAALAAPAAIPELALVLDRLPPSQRLLLQGSAAFRGPFERQEVASLAAGWTAEDLRQLQLRGLIRSAGEALELPPLVASAVRERWPLPPGSLVAWALGAALPLALGSTGPEFAAAHDAIGRMRPTLVAAIAAAGADDAARLVLALAPQAQARGPWPELESLALAVLERGPARPLAHGLQSIVARVRAWTGRGDAAEAVLEPALQEAPADALLAAAEVALARGRTGLERLRSLALRTDHGSDDQRGIAARYLALALRYEGHLDEADAELERSARLLRRCEHIAELSETLRQQADVASMRRDTDQSRRLAQLSLSLAQGDTRREAQSLECIGRLACETAAFDEARRALGRARALLGSLGARRREALVSVSLGEAHLYLGELQPAEEALSSALDAALALADPRLEGAAREALARCWFDRGDWPRAIEQAARSAELFAQLGEAMHHGLATWSGAAARHAAGDLQGARSGYALAALALAQFPSLLAELLANWTVAELEQGLDAAPLAARARALDATSRLAVAAEAAATGGVPAEMMAELSRGPRTCRQLARLLERLATIGDELRSPRDSAQRTTEVEAMPWNEPKPSGSG